MVGTTQAIIIQQDKFCLIVAYDNDGEKQATRTHNKTTDLLVANWFLRLVVIQQMMAESLWTRIKPSFTITKHH